MMKRIKLRLKSLFFLINISFLLLLLVVLFSCRDNREIPLIGIDEDGEEVVTYLPFKGYTRESVNTINELSFYTMDSLNYVEKKNGEQRKNPSWELKSFFIGLTLAAGIGIGDYGLEGQGTVYLFFDKQ
ncbi:MAG: hypothetical protein HQK49_17515 [Oligoflexia bacterium]|nr:hypothetical protein [Oligoflexia bacterium]